MIRLEGRVWKDESMWLAEIPILDAMTQGRTRSDVLTMAGDLVESLSDVRGFRARARFAAGERFEVTSQDVRTLIALVLRRQRQVSGLSLADVAGRLNARSRNGYAGYEQGRSVPTIEKLGELLRAVSDRDLVIGQSQE